MNKSQTRYLVASIVLHIVVFGALFLSAYFQRKPEPPRVIVAALVQGGGKVEPAPAPPEPKPLPPEPEPPKPKPPEPPKPKPEPPKPDPEKQRVEQERKEKQRIQDEERKLEERRIKEDAQRKLQEEKKKKQEEEQQRKEDEKRQKQAVEDERKRMLDEERKEIEETKRQRELEAKRARDALAAAAAAEQAARDAAIVGAAQAQWGDLIAARVRKFWQRPMGSADNFQCLVEVKMLPSAEVISARVVRSCGSAALDRSVEQAVVKASPLPPPPDSRAMPSDRTLNITFCPNAGGC